MQPASANNAGSFNDELLAVFKARKPWLVNRKIVSSHIFTPKYINNLINSDSPYLLSHSLQPVDWIEWQPSFESDFKSGDKLVFVSIGYSTCHWCHVMAEESFANTDIADILNQSYISIKVDREQWPLVDERFKSALELLKGEAGWPLNVILTPEGKIVWIDSYLNKDKFTKVIQGLAKRWQKQPKAIFSLASRIEATVNPDPLPTSNPETNPLSKSDWRKLLPKQHQSVYQALLNEQRPGEPRFFREIWQLGLLDEYLRTGNEAYLKAVENQLSEILLSPVFDAIDGSFHRYTVDSEWKTPHFEKMLYTQANMITLLAKAYGITGKQHYRIAMEQTIDWVELWLKNDSGYSSAVSAISEGQEGKYYHFSETPLDSGTVNVAGFKVVNRFTHDIQNENVQNYLISLDSLDSDWRELTSYQELKKYRKQKVKPELDEKVIVSWNSRYAIALLDAFEVTDKAEYLENSISLLESLWQAAKLDGELYRIVFLGRASIPPQMEDYALFAKAQFRLAFYQPWQTEKDDESKRKFYAQSDGNRVVESVGESIDESETSIMTTSALHDSSAATRGNWLLEQMMIHFDENGEHDGKSLYAKITNLNTDGEQSSVYTSVYEALALGELYSQSPVYKKLIGRFTKNHSHLPIEMFKHYSFVSSVADSLSPARLNHAIFAKGHGRIKAFYSEPNLNSKPNEVSHGGVIKVTFTMENGWHVNANSVSKSRFIPTTVKLDRDVADSQTDTDIRYPEPRIRKLGFSDSKLALYEGRFEIFLEGGVIQEGELQKELKSIDIRIQACSDQLCLLPETIKLNL
ncbi:thioredoxin domain-containing protein [Shewanella psychrophila]|uniref:thioredoxin domain-containing protein n=1 Tax=Shewanella psychrophila TaxID=225848 RepID=UPI0014752658|nr:DUF255 domain-containing protein [Shewanella psychrophila]